MARDVCRTDEPPLYEVTESETDRGSACHFWRECLHG
jgi:oligopeptide transport system ATP-binding protein